MICSFHKIAVQYNRIQYVYTRLNPNSRKAAGKSEVVSMLQEVAARKSDQVIAAGDFNHGLQDVQHSMRHCTHPRHASNSSRPHTAYSMNGRLHSTIDHVIQYSLRLQVRKIFILTRGIVPGIFLIFFLKLVQISLISLEMFCDHPKCVQGHVVYLREGMKCQAPSTRKGAT